MRKTIMLAMAGLLALLALPVFAADDDISSGDEVASWGSFSMTMVSKADGSQTPSVGRYTDVSRRVDGQWLYVIDHASDDLIAAPSN